MALVHMEKLVVNVPLDQAAQLREKADREQRSVAGLIRLAISDYLAKLPDAGQADGC